jgi:Spy/CpxP family protein refolding chaperone
MKTKTRNLLIGTAIAAAVGATGVAAAGMGGYAGACPQGAQMQQGQGGHGPGMMQGGGMMGQGGPGAMMGHMMGQGPGGMMGQMMGGMQGMPGMGGMMGGTGPGLDLSDEQKAELGKLRQQLLPKMGELRGKMQANHEQLRAQMHGSTADEAAIGELADQKGALMAEMIKLHAAQRARMQALLTDEQREQMRQRRQGMGPGMMGTPPAGG